jgi:AcrR family transcriptional regulator
MSTDLPAQPPRGRPRSERARRAVHEAALALLDEGGYPAATIEAVAQRSGVARTTIYRWWPNRAALVVEVLVEISSAAAPPPSGADPLRAIRTELRRIAVAASSLPGRLLVSLLAEAQHDPQVRTALQQGIWHPRREAGARMIREAQARGELRADVSPHLAADLFYGPLFFRILAGYDVVTERFATQVFEQVIRGLGAAGSKA